MYIQLMGVYKPEFAVAMYLVSVPDPNQPQHWKRSALGWFASGAETTIYVPYPKSISQYQYTFKSQ